MNTLKQLLDQYEIPVYEKEEMNSEEDYPESFFAFENFKIILDKYYCNVPTRKKYGFKIYYYSKDAELVFTRMNDLQKLLRRNGAIVEEIVSNTNDNLEQYSSNVLTYWILENI